MDHVKEGAYVRWRQMMGTTKKNWLFSLRSWKTTLLQIVAPLIFTALLVGVDYVPKYGNDNPYNPLPQNLDPAIVSYGPVPHCKQFNDIECVAIRYSLDDNTTQSQENLHTIMGYIVEDNGLSWSEVEYIGSSADLLQWLTDHPNTTTVGLAFYDVVGPRFSYNVVFNSSYNTMNLFDIRRKPDARNELQISVDRAIMRFVLGDAVSLDVSYKPFPQLGYETGQSTMAEYGTVFFFCGIMFQYVILLYNICMEKDNLLRRGMKLIGLKDSIYWLSWFVNAMIIATLAVFVLMATGYALQLEYYTNTDFSVNFVLFVLFSLALVTMAFFSTVFIGTAKGSLNLGMGVFVLGLLFVAVCGNSYTVEALYDDDLVPSYVTLIFEFVPPFNLAKAMADINSAYAQLDSNGMPKNVTRFTWDSLYEPRYIEKMVDGELVYKPLPSTIVAFNLLLMNFALFYVLTWYLDAVLPAAHGERRPLWFFLLPSYWGIKIKRGKGDDHSNQTNGDRDPLLISAPFNGSLNGFSGSTVDKDVIEEYHSALSGDGENLALRILGLGVKFYTFSLKSLLRCRPKTTLKAVDHLYLNALDGQILSLLGHNGAGKTTTINILTGMMSPDEGDAIIYGKSILTDMDEIRDRIGVCPQHDILWNEITAREHVEIFCHMRCIPRDKISSIVRERLEDVQLLEVADNAVGSFSGGMKRRLSVALSFIGDPKFMFLDEPTTGMDPYVRRDVWNLILRSKKGRVIIMTTHSMEEADVLGDKIAVMAHGQLKCVGSSVHLKNRFAGYKINLSVKEENLPTVQQLIYEKIGKADLDRDNQVRGVHNMTYSVSKEQSDLLVPFFEHLENSKGLALDFSISQTTLEEVFMKVTQESNDEQEVLQSAQSGKVSPSPTSASPTFRVSQ